MPSPGAPAWATRASFRIDYTPELLDDLRHRYERTPESCDSIAARHGFTRGTLRLVAKRCGWVRFKRPALDLSPAAKLDARLAAAEQALPSAAGEGPPGEVTSLSFPRSAPSSTLPPRSGGEGRIAIPDGDCNSGWGASLQIANSPGRAEAPPPPTPDPSPPFAAQTGGGESALTWGGEKQAAPPQPPNAAGAGENCNSAPAADGTSSPRAAVLHAAVPNADAFAAAFQRTAAAALAEAQAQIEALKAARLQMQETGRVALAAQLAHDLSSITNSLYRIKRIHGGASDDSFDNDDLSDLDQRRRAVARRILEFLKSRRAGSLGGAGERAGCEPAGG